MGAFAVIRLPLDLSRRSAAASVALDVVGTFPGTRNVVLDTASGMLNFEMQFPGNLSELVSRLRSRIIPVGDVAGVSVPVRNLALEILRDDPDALRRRLADGPEVWDPQFARGRYVTDGRANGDCVEASIVPSSNAMHELYDALLTLGLVAHDEAYAARGV